ncbi:unnamed protein product [Caenorhabditis angaria]|uniref:Protein kinase domain-containing protein n=1 Tax=Caenorhabditis angaria TaxID=860376 RepID=A0A9P1IU29_9PELO|nr:unnamed protein product [Caenorhabditis angaria]
MSKFKHRTIPEVFLGLGFNEIYDVWSFGCLLSELYTGQLLFFGDERTNSEESQLDVMQTVLRRSIPYYMYERAFDSE